MDYFSRSSVVLQRKMDAKSILFMRSYSKPKQHPNPSTLCSCKYISAFESQVECWRLPLASCKSIGLLAVWSTEPGRRSVPGCFRTENNREEAIAIVHIWNTNGHVWKIPVLHVTRDMIKDGMWVLFQIRGPSFLSMHEIPVYTGVCILCSPDSCFQ